MEHHQTKVNMANMAAMSPFVIMCTVHYQEYGASCVWNF